MLRGRGRGPYRGEGRGRSYAVATRNSTYADSNQSEEKKMKAPEVFTLTGRQPAPHIVMAWLRAMYYHAGQEYSRHGLHWILHPSTPKKPTAIVRPTRPDKSDYDDQDDLTLYKEDVQIYMNDKKRADDKLDQLKEDKTKLFNFMATYIQEETKNTLSNRKTPAIWTNEDPEELTTSVKTVFLGQVQGTVGNSFDASKARKKFENLNQRDNETAAEFKIRYEEEFKALIQSEVNGGATETDALAAWTEKKRVEHYCFRMAQARMPLINFCQQHQYGDPPKPLPATFEAAYKQQCTAENEQYGSARTEMARGNLFLAGGAKIAGNKRGQQQPQQQSSAGRKQEKQSKQSIVNNEERPKDADGRWVCWNYIIGNCRRDKCKLSHKRVANGLAPPQWWLDEESAKAKANGQVDDDINEAVAETRRAIKGSLLDPDREKKNL